MKVKLLRWLNYIPLVMVGLFTAAVLVCLAFIYGHGAAAIAAGDAKERTQLSQDGEIREDGEAGAQISSRFNCMTPDVATADGVTIFSEGQTVEAPYYNLIGIPYHDGTKYLTDCYWEDHFEKTWSVWTGIRQSADSQTPVLQTTLNAAVQQTMYDYLTENGVSGSVFAYDYMSGGVLCSVSTPAGSSEDDPKTLESGALMNKPLDTTPPGSTQKLVTLFLLAQQGVDLDSLSYTCTGSVTINGNVYVCEGNHGDIHAEEAVAKSCNAFFAQAVSEHLNFEQAAQTLKELGWSVNGSEAGGKVGKIPAAAGKVTLNVDAVDFSTIWTMIGETEITVSPVWMARFAAACTGENVCEPCFMADETGSPDSLFQNDSDAIEKVSEIWREAAEITTPPEGVSFGKTGTYEFDGDSLQKNYMGVSEELHLAFYITEENYRENGTDLAVTPLDITEKLLSTAASVKE